MTRPEGAGGRRRPAVLSPTALIFWALILGVLLGHLLPAETSPRAYETFP